MIYIGVSMSSNKETLKAKRRHFEKLPDYVAELHPPVTAAEPARGWSDAAPGRHRWDRCRRSSRPLLDDDRARLHGPARGHGARAQRLSASAADCRRGSQIRLTG